MTTNTWTVSKQFDLTRLKAEKLLENSNFSVVLGDDIWEQSTLLVKSGGYLTEDLINKLINFGITQVSVDFVKKNEEEAEESFVFDFIKTQSVLIIENNLMNTAWLVSKLVDIGFNEGNIFVTADYNSINKYFRAKKINFMFVGLALYEKCKKCVNKYSLLRNTHTFVMVEKNDSVRKIQTDFVSDIRFLRKPLSLKYFKFLINNALDENWQNLYAEDVDVS